MVAQARKHRFTVEEFEQLSVVPVFGEDARLELIDGEIFDMAGIGSRHAGCVNSLTNHFATLAGQAVVSVQNPIRLGDFTEPQPDVMLLRPRDDFYATAHPGPADVLLLIEVADTSLSHDRDRKLPLYLAGVPEVWIIDLPAACVAVHRADVDTTVQRPGDVLAPPAFPEAAVAVADLVGEAPPA